MVREDNREVQGRGKEGRDKEKQFEKKKRVKKICIQETDYKDGARLN